VQKVIRVSALGGYRIYVEFEDGTAGQVDLGDRLFGPVFEPLRNEGEFRKVAVDEFGAVAWPCGADLAPDALYRRLATGVSG
jgi:hypothetical protein